MYKRHGLATTTQTVCHAPAEPRAVDRHDGIRPERPDRRCSLAHTPQNNRRSRHDFGDTRYGNVAERREAGKTLFLHALSADPGDLETAPRTLAQRSDQSAAKGITRGFSSNQEN
jgi:hypothetical protein